MEHDDVSGAGAQASELQEEKEEAPSYSSPPAAETADDAPPEPEAAAGNVEETEADTIEVNLKFIHHDRVSLRCSPQIHVAELKERVVVEVEHASSAAEGAGASESTANLRLIYKGKVLKDDQTLASYHFQDGDTLHAVFGRPNTTAMSPEAAPAVAPEPTTPPTTSSGMQDMGNGVVMGSFEMEAGMPDIGGLINSMLAGFGGAGSGAASIHIATTDVPVEHINTGTANGGGISATTTGSSNNADSRASPAAISTATGPRATTVTPTPPATGTTATSRGSNMRNIADVTDQVSTLRRMMPPLELGSLSRPPDLDSELYALGNAVRDASDTFLAMHRQMQFLSTRLLHEHLLSERDRARLRTRVQHLIPALYTAGALSNSVGESLESSRYGPGSGGSTSEAPTSRTPSIPFARPVPQDQRPGGDGSGASRTHQQGPSLGDSIADVLRVVSGVTTGLANMTTSRPQPPPAPMGPPRGPTRPPAAVPQEEVRGMSDFISMLASFEPSAPPRATVPRRPAPEIDGGRSGPSTIPERPLAALLIESARSLETSNLGSREFYEDLCRYLQALFRGASSNEERKRLGREWCQKAADEIEEAMRKAFMANNFSCQEDSRRRDGLALTLGHFQESCLERLVGEEVTVTGNGPLRPNLQVIRRLWHRVWVKLLENVRSLTTSQSTPTLLSATIGELLESADPTLRPDAEALRAMIVRDAQNTQ